MSTRRSDGYEFDFGAQYFTVRNDLFRAAVESWLRHQRVDIWQGKLVEVVATPPAQAMPLLADAPRIAVQVAAVEMLPCWAVNLAFGQSLGVGTSRLS